MEYIARQQTNYLGHIARQKNTCKIKRLLFNGNKNRKRSRPFKTLKEHVLKKSRLSANEFYKLALKKKKKGYGWLRL